MLVSGRPFPASPAAGEAEAGPRRDDDKLAGGGSRLLTVRPLSPGRAGRSSAGSTRPSSLPLAKGKGRTSLGLWQPTPAVHEGPFAQRPSARGGSSGSLLIPTRGSSKHQWQTSPRGPAEGPQRAIKRGRRYLRSPQSHPPPPAPAAPRAGLPAAFKEEARQFRAQTSPQVSPTPLGLSLQNPLP